MKRIRTLALGLMIAGWSLGCRGASAVSDDAGRTPMDVAQDRAPAVDRTADLLGELNPVCGEGMQTSCASPSNPLVGVCHAGKRSCEGGRWGACLGEVLPAAEESCNGFDDDCDGMVDEGCPSDCLVVCANCSESESDAGMADGSLLRPFTTLEDAMAAAGDRPGRICVAAGNSCMDTWTYKLATPLVIGDGLHIQGSYALTSDGLSYCHSSAKPRTALEFTSNQGVIFEQDVTTGAELSGFLVEVRPVEDGEAAIPTTAVSVSGAHNVFLSRVFIGDGVTGLKTYGVSITANGEATIIGSAISTGQGRELAIGVHVEGGRVNLRNNCDDLKNGTCNSLCSDCGPLLGIRGYVAEGISGAPMRSSVVSIAGGSGSSVVGNMICGGSSRAPSPDAMAAAVLCERAGCGTVSGNLIIGGTDRDTIGLALIGSDPLVDGNYVEGGCASRSSTAVWLQGSSARLQNNRLLSGHCLGTDSPAFYGVRVQLEKASDNPDVHSNDIEPQGTSDCQSVGVILERSSALAAASGGMLRNNIIGAGTCGRRTAVRESEGTSLRVLAHNDLYAPKMDPPEATVVLYHHAADDAVSAAQVNEVPGAKGNVSADPGYLASLSDFHLSPGSTCIDQGGADGAPDSDGERKPRPVGAGFDIGAYEFAPGTGLQAMQDKASLSR